MSLISGFHREYLPYLQRCRYIATSYSLTKNVYTHLKLNLSQYPTKDTNYKLLFLLLLPHPFPLLCGVDVSYETPPLNSVLRFLPWQFSLRQSIPDVIQPPPLWSSSPSFPRHLHPHHSLAYVFVFPSQYMPMYNFNLLFCTFMDISPTFVVPLILSLLMLSSFVTPLIHLNILISATSNFFSCAFFTAHVSPPYIIAGLTTVLYTSPWLSSL